jgi:hypothetical protein
MESELMGQRRGSLVGARGVLHDPRDSEQRTGDYAAYKKSLCYTAVCAQGVRCLPAHRYLRYQLSNDKYLYRCLSVIANLNLARNERKLSNRSRG